MKIMHLIQISMWLIPKSLIEKVNSVLGNSLALNRPIAVTWTNLGQVLWHHTVSPEAAYLI